jgi:hypothetical protein
MRHQAIWDGARHTLGVSEIDHAHQEFIQQVAALIAASETQDYRTSCKRLKNKRS